MPILHQPSETTPRGPANIRSYAYERIAGRTHHNASIRSVSEPAGHGASHSEPRHSRYQVKQDYATNLWQNQQWPICGLGRQGPVVVDTALRSPVSQ